MLKQKLSDEVKQYQRLKFKEYEARQSIIRIIGILEDTLSAYRRLPETPEVKEGIIVASNTIREWRKKLSE